ncbi:MAG: gamma-glutamylcyclotransferase [Defluviimonas sp.]|uniref:gamma-glutamylcyclotransferase n=1 Tax=Albidovulum sp. TaxID=1872424 RepID=UPI001DED8CF8|nr:gamma-glutamylcyclotransferase [Paracoccaceae bacterium]MCC0065389.1 gamma-glutamylcyclotransferase [Defluviimonas sp.]
MRHFFYGTLRDPDLLRLVIGRTPVATPATLPGHSVLQAADGAYPVLVPAGAGAAGLLVSGLEEEDRARLDFYEGGFAYGRVECVVETAGVAVAAQVYQPPDPAPATAGTWSLDDWQARWNPVVLAAADEMMRGFGRLDPALLHRRYGQMLTRAGARLRAARPAPAPEIRRLADRRDVAVARVTEAYGGFFAVEDYELRHRLFDGSMSAPLDRSVVVSGDAAVVLPYDPRRDRVLVIEQFRMGPVARGDGQPWLIEAVAGRIDGGETPEEAARREAREEAGLSFSALLPVAGYYPSPAALSEYLYSFVGIADLPDGSAGPGGLENEGEDIRAHLLPAERLFALAASGEVNNAPLLLLSSWLKDNRARLQDGTGA